MTTVKLGCFQSVCKSGFHFITWVYDDKISIWRFVVDAIGHENAAAIELALTNYAISEQNKNDIAGGLRHIIAVPVLIRDEGAHQNFFCTFYVLSRVLSMLADRAFGGDFSKKLKAYVDGRLDDMIDAMQAGWKRHRCEMLIAETERLAERVFQCGVLPEAKRMRRDLVPVLEAIEKIKQ